MIWYEMTAGNTVVLFVMLLLTTVLQMLIALNSSEMPREKRALRLFRLQYSLLAVVSAVLSLEAIAAIASVEGGIYLAIPSLPRYEIGRAHV